MRIRAILLLALGVTLFGVMDGLRKLLARDYSVVQVVWARYAFALPAMLAMARRPSWPTLLRCRRPRVQAIRGSLPLLASITVIAALQLMPLADCTAISFASPLLVVALSAPLLKERISLHSWIGVVFGFAGVLIVVRPGTGVIAWAAVFPLATAFFFALYQLLTRLVSRGDDAIVTLAWTILVGLVLTSVVLPFRWHPVAPRDWILLALSGVIFLAGQALLIRAFSLAAAAVLAPFTYVQIVAAVAFGAAVFGELPDLWTISGTAVIILAGLYVLHRQPGVS